VKLCIPFTANVNQARPLAVDFHETEKSQVHNSIANLQRFAIQVELEKLFELYLKCKSL